MSTVTPTPIPRRWRLEPPHGRDRRIGLSVRQRRLWLLAAGMLLLVGVAAGMLRWIAPSPSPRFVPLWVNEYRSPLVIDNDAAELDRRAIQNGRYFQCVSACAVGSLERHRILQELAALEKLTADDAAVVYLSAYAVHDADGSLSLLPADFVPGDVRSQLPLTDVLKQIQRCPAKGKLLVLDLMWPLAEAGRSSLSQTAGVAAAKELDELHDPNLYVLCAASPGQKSLVSVELGRSVFSFYFEQALRGYADGCGAAGLRDGRIRVGELAQFVCDGVDHWAWQNCRRRQTPRFLGHSEDFELVSLPHGEPLPALAPLARRGYPIWLREAWQVRDTLKSQGAVGLAPRLLAQWERELLAAENAWQLGEDAARVQDDLKGRSTAFSNRWDGARRVVAGPPPRSLASLRRQGLSPDPKIATCLENLLSKLAAQTAGLQAAPALAVRQKLAAQFLEDVKDAPPAARAMAIFDHLARETNPRPDLVRLLDGLLATDQPHPLYVETNFLRRLAGLTEQIPSESWPAGSVRQSLQLVRLGEHVVGFQRGLKVSLPLIEPAAGQRRLAEMVLLNPTYAAITTADRALRNSAALYEQAQVRLETLHSASSRLEAATALLLAVEPLVDEDDSKQSSWLATAKAAAELADQMDAAVRPGELQNLGQRSLAVQSQIEGLSQSFSADELQRVQQRLRRPDVDPTQIDRASLLLTTSCLAAGDRAALWQARHDAALRIALRFNNCELLEFATNQRPAKLDAYSAQLAEQRDNARATARADRTTALLRLGGVALENEKTSAETWEALLEQRLTQAKTAAQRDRLSRIYPSQAPCPLLDEPATNPTLELRRSEALQSWQWLASWYRYLSHDIVDDTFFAEAASDYLNCCGPVSETWIQWDKPRLIPQQDQCAPLTVEVPWRVAGPHATGIKLPLDLILPAGSPWQATLVNSSIQCGEPLRLQIQSMPPGEPAAIPPRGCVLLARLGTREFHLPVSLADLGNAREWDVALSANPDSSAPAQHALRLRPLAAWQPHFVLVQNRGAQPRTVVVQLNPGGISSEKVIVAPGQRQRISFVAALPKENTELPLLVGPLVARVLDAGTGDELAKETLHIGVASPREYVAIDSIQFQPTGLKPNRLSLTARAMPTFTPPACLVELLLPPQRIEGFAGVKAGVFRGLLARENQTLQLSADALNLSEETGDAGCIYINVDDCPRAFVYRGTFARRGEATTPYEDPQPALRLNAPRLALAGPKVTAGLEVDEGPSGATLLLELGSNRQGVFRSEQSSKFPTPRQQRIGLAPGGPAGALLLSAAIRDWQAEMDATGIVGHRRLCARLISVDGQTICTAEQPITLDDSPPTGVQLMNVPRRAAKGAPLVLTARGQDDLSGITEAKFFLGAPVDGKLPQGMITAVGKPLDAASEQWTAALELPPGAKGEISVGVQFTNGVGLSTLATATLDVADAADLALGKIVGSVTEGPRPQAGLEVVLKTDKGAELGKTKTGDNGEFTFNSVAPGSYKLSTAKPTSLRKAEASVTVDKAQTAAATLRLEL